ncbi:MAG: SRPBCC family protein [Acidimicrobiales bacterium]
MAEQTTRRMTISASPERVWQALIDFDRYHEWAPDLKEAAVVEHDQDGRATQVTFRAAAMGRSTSYTLAYDYARAPHELTWHLAAGDIMRRLDGSYTLDPVDGEPHATDVTYDLAVELVLPLPGFVKRRAEARIIHTALEELKDYLESDQKASA